MASDVTLIAGGGGGGGARGRSFWSHSAILAARCPYFRRPFAHCSFAESAAPQLELPGVDPGVLAAVLRYIYTGDPGYLPRLPAAVLRPLAKLADRLLLPEMHDHAAARMVRFVAPGTVVDTMLWADGAGAGMEALRQRLYAAHRAEALQLP
ncbi:hypothetical protein GPECTOR_62g899 [Gonium pectorale]|uniref:BTB domain-containing protein n=1 Tax=Gonium pectorale TaxID=33097 RepID=A0A150G4N4_GONPE|nr:hypothetical protein GPECTOR_62g899 [Gonium pectorale]|eukprot:KXZ44784.1 hypothetical protein GPECTOR_62g899 [Gonium pectorale]